MAAFTIDTSDYREMQAAMLLMPEAIKAKAFARASKRIATMAKTRIARTTAKDAGMRVGDVRKTMAAFNAGQQTAKIVMRSGWMPLSGLGKLTQTKRGVRVRGWGSHRGAFVATMKSGHTGAFVRIKGTRMRNKNKEQIRELWGPNPVSFVLKDEEKYVGILAQLMKEKYAPRVLHELDNILRIAR